MTKLYAVLVLGLLIAGCGRAGSPSSPPLTASEQRASEILQEGGNTKSDSDAAARELHQMLQRDKQLGR